MPSAVGVAVQFRLNRRLVCTSLQVFTMGWQVPERREKSGCTESSAGDMAETSRANRPQTHARRASPKPSLGWQKPQVHRWARFSAERERPPPGNSGIASSGSVAGISDSIQFSCAAGFARSGCASIRPYRTGNVSDYGHVGLCGFPVVSACGKGAIIWRSLFRLCDI